MKLSAAFALFTDLSLGVRAAIGPTFHAVLSTPSLLLRPMAIRRLLMAHVWNVFGDLVDEGSRPVKHALVTRYAYGVVLDIGAGQSRSTFPII
jgi:hypothetical protein